MSAKGLTRGWSLGLGWSIVCVVVPRIAHAPRDALLAHAARRLPKRAQRCTANAADITPLRHSVWL